MIMIYGVSEESRAMLALIKEEFDYLSYPEELIETYGRSLNKIVDTL